MQALFLNDEYKGKIIDEQAKDISYFVRCPLAPLYSSELLPFSEDIALYVSDLGSVTHFAIQIAIYMGFSTLYLYGIDNTYKKYLGMDGCFHLEEGGSSHISGISPVRDDISANRVPKTKCDAYRMGGFADMRKATLGYQACLNYATEHGVQILNATRGGKLEMFDRISLEDALGVANG